MTDKNLRVTRLQNNPRIGEKEVDDIKPVVEFCSMNTEMKNFCIEKAKEAMKSIEAGINYYKKLAKKIKLDLELEKNETWNCVVGTDFGAYIAFDKAYLIYFRMDELYFMIFRFGADVDLYKSTK